MHSSIVSTIQECYYDYVSFGITPNLVQEISSVSKPHQSVYFILYMSLSKRPKCSYPQPKLSGVSGIKTCPVEQKTGNCSDIVPDSVAPTESMLSVFSGTHSLVKDIPVISVT